jgi:hypothetical protein
LSDVTMPRQGLAYVPPEPRPQMATYDGKAPSQRRYFDELGFALGKRLSASADSDDALVASFRQIGLSVGKGFEWQTLDEATRRGLARAITTGSRIVDSKWAAAGQIVNGWKHLSTRRDPAGFDVDPLRAAFRRVQPPPSRSAMAAKRRLQPAGMRKERSSVDGLANASHRPACRLNLIVSTGRWLDPFGVRDEIAYDPF